MNLLKNKRLYNPYIIMGILFLLIAATVDQTKQHPIALLMFSGMVVLCGIAVALLAAGKLTEKKILILLIAAGILLRVGYTLYTPYMVRQHDVSTFESGEGHAGYILYIARHFALPDTNVTWQFYHPPLHHILAAIWLDINLKLGAAAETAYENVQLLPCFYSCASMIVCLKIFRELSLPRRAVIAGMAVICFHPTFILLAGSLNNDMLMILFSFVVILYALRWYRDSSMKNMALAGLFLGLAMMTKISAVILAPMLAFLFLVKWWPKQGHKDLMIKQLKQGTVFCFLSIPLGLWYAVRNYLLFRQKLFYVPYISDSYQYIGNYGFADRLWKIPWHQLLTPYQDWTYGYSIPLSLLKTATFGETDFRLWPIADILFYANILLVLLSVYAMIRMIFTKRKEANTSVYQSLGIFWFILMFCYMKFCLTYTSICTQDFRYIVPTILTGSIFLGAYMVQTQNDTLHHKIFVTAAKSAVMLFCIFSSAVYIALGFNV